jgi:putative oxidoreductase
MKNQFSDDALALAGRVLIAVLFLPSALGKLAGFAVVSQVLAGKGLPFPALCLAGAIALEIAASVALVAGWRVRWVALALGLFTLVAGMLFHDFWNVPDAMVMAQRQAFFKNIGLLGGLFILAARGPGRFSLDARTGAASVPSSMQPQKT